MTERATAAPGRTASSQVLLDDGTTVVIRPLAATDRAGLDALHRQASDASLRFRFFGVSRHSGPAYVRHVFSADGPALCLVAVVDGGIAAVASAERTGRDGAAGPTGRDGSEGPEGPGASAEVAFLVADPVSGHGLGGLLLERLAAAACDIGISRFTAEVLTDNTAMNCVFRAAGFHPVGNPSSGVARVERATAWPPPPDH